MKNLLIAIFLVIFCPKLMAQESGFDGVKTYSNFVDYRKKLIAAKSDNWRLGKETREISAKQKWPKSKLEESLKEIKEFETELKTFKTDLSSFDDEEKFRFESLAKKISDKDKDLKESLQLQNKINDKVKNLRNVVNNARNKTRELLAVQVNSESLYRQRYGSSDFPATGLEVIEARLKTQEQLSEIFNIDNEIDEIERIHAMGYSFVPQNDQEFYDPKKIAASLEDIDSNLKKIIEKTVQDLKIYKRRMLAISSMVIQ